MNNKNNSRDNTKYWCDGSAVWTHYGNASSIIFPAWEHAFTAIVKSYLDDVTDEKLKMRMLEFIEEENNHAAAHHAFNIKYGLEEEEALQYKATRAVLKKPRLKFWLGTMVSIEHLAACMGRSYLDKWSSREGAEFNLFCYHAKEELGHKSLALDLWDYMGYDRQELRKIAFVNQKYVIGFLLKYTIGKLRDTGELYKWNTIKDLFSCFSYVGYKILVPALRIYKNSFSPNDIDDSRYL